MKKSGASKAPRGGKPPRNPHARALRSGAHKPKVIKGKDEYRRNPKHRQSPDRDEADD